MRFFTKTAGLSVVMAPVVALLLAAVPAQAQSGSLCDSETVVPAGHDALRADCEALWDFYTQLDDPGVLDDADDGQWGPDNPLSSWQGVTINPQTARIGALDLNYSNMVGPISPALSRLSGLFYLSLGGNELTGPIPPELGQLPSLWHLSLWRNKLTGTIPTTLAQLNNLGHLALDNNQLSGPIPSELGGLTGLSHLDLSGNDLTGSIPIELGQLSKLKALLLWGNRLTDPIPPELGQLTELTLLHIDGNELSGQIPPQLGQLSKLTELNASFNDLTGPIPPELGQLAELTSLELSGNQLEWRMPPELSRFDPFRSDPLGLVAFSEVHRSVTLGNEAWDVWFCDTPNGNVVVDPDVTLMLLNGDILSYFRWLSNDRYQPSFVNAGLIQGPDLAGCEIAIRARRQETPSNNRFVVIDDTNIFAGFVNGAWWDPSTMSVAAGAVSVVEVKNWPEAINAIITHEMGHALGFPHSFGGSIHWSNGNVYEGDNPMDAVSGNIALGATTGTIAVNRYAAGWIDPGNVAVHPSGKSYTYDLRALGSSGTQMLVLPAPRFGVMMTLGARVAKGYDSTIPKEGIEVYRVDQRGNGCSHPLRNACWALLRRTQPYPPAELSYGTGDDLDNQRKAGLTQHVHSVGEVFEVGTATVEVLERSGDNFRVRVVDSAEPVFAGRFSDDDGGAHESNIEAIAARGVTLGCSPTYPDRFCPGRVITRAQMMAFLARALGVDDGAAALSSRFPDVSAGAWYSPYLERLADLGVAVPYEDGTFRPFEPLTRSDMAVFLTRAFSHISAVSEPAGAFTDVPADAPYAAEVEAVLAAGVTRGCSAEPMLYCPDESVTRAQMASFLARALQSAP